MGPSIAGTSLVPRNLLGVVLASAIWSRSFYIPFAHNVEVQVKTVLSHGGASNSGRVSTSPRSCGSEGAHCSIQPQIKTSQFMGSFTVVITEGEMCFPSKASASLIRLRTQLNTSRFWMVMQHFFPHHLPYHVFSQILVYVKIDWNLGQRQRSSSGARYQRVTTYSVMNWFFPLLVARFQVTMKDVCRVEIPEAPEQLHKQISLVEIGPKQTKGKRKIINCGKVRLQKCKKVEAYAITGVKRKP
ncbi:hypothetical protein G4B88_029153 [Cannabis sativa]|uniref:Uncharacterized protein n=1 Tax=Cannabis sativa TaxID=3483 RepID=A0A7J6F0P6_CANSA|nr:hypothetical protein G4B88_029153 [Cannabis sativa]